MEINGGCLLGYRGIKGQLGVSLTVYPYLLCSLGILCCRFDLALNQAAKPWVSPIFRSFLVPSVADCFRTCIGDKSATLG